MLTIVEASEADYREVSDLVKQLLIELEPETREEIQEMNLKSISKDLLSSSRILAFLAKYGEINIGILTLHVCSPSLRVGCSGLPPQITRSGYDTNTTLHIC